MKFWIVLLKIFGYMWIGLGGLLIFVGIIGTWMTGGFSAVQALMSPFNVINWITMMITLAPGLGVLYWSDKLKNQMPEERERKTFG